MDKSAHQMQLIHGIPASPGIVTGPAFLVHDENLVIETRSVTDSDNEWSRLEIALLTAKAQLEDIHQQALTKTGVEEAAIFEAHALFLDDPDLLDTVRELLNSRQVNIEKAWNEGVELYATQMEALEDNYFRARAADIRDVGRRVLRILIGVSENRFSALNQPAVIVARDLTPADTIKLERSMVLAFCIAEGGATSHTAILAKALGVPAVVGAGSTLLLLRQGETVIVDGSKGELISSPDESTRSKYEELHRQDAVVAEAEKVASRLPAVTLDGYTVEVVANIGSGRDAITALEFGAEGVGLMRTEFTYLDRSTAPDEEEQLRAYRQVFDVMQQRPVVVRTLDAGGDKELPYLDLGQEANPFLGWRAIRMCLDQPEFFKVQLRALLRASPGHDLRIMFPMIATLDEVRRAKALLKEAEAEVRAAGHPVAEQIQVGIMVEIPAAAVLADLFAREVDFFSIGTNDLTQYTLAADRGNDKLSRLSDACYPAVLRLIQSVVTAAHAHGIWVGLCGEMGGDPEAVPILLGMGIDELSMAPASIPRAKKIIREWEAAEARNLVEAVINLDSAEAVRQTVRRLAQR
jgi:phosphoenolpyruvate-protein phosphotransferase